MMRLLLLILLISANCMKMNCDEETSTTESISEVSEKTEILSADPESLQSKAEDIETDKANKASEVDEEVPVPRSSSNRSKRNETQYDDSSKIDSIEISVTEKSAPDIVVKEKETESRTNSSEDSQDDTKSAEIIEKQLKELSETSASEAEDEKAGDLLEASAESKLSDNENASSYVDESDRNSETENMNEKSDESGLNEGLQTRRMLSNNNVVIDTKMRAGTTSNEVPPEEKTALKQNINTYNFNEFGSDSRNKLINSSPTEPSVTTTVPVIPKSAPQEIFNQQYIPKYYPRPELTINFPNVNSDFQGPRDLPIYLKVKQDEAQLRNQFIEAQSSQLKSTEENSYFNSRNQQQYHESQRMLNFPIKGINKQFEDSRVETRNQVPRFSQNQLSTNFDNQQQVNTQSTNLNRYSINQIQTSYQNQARMNNDHRHLQNTIRDARPQVQEKANSKMVLNTDDQGNEYPLYRQPQEMIDSKIKLENNQFGIKRLTNPYPYLQPSRPQQIELLNAPTRIDVIPKQIQFLFQKLASASEYPSKLPTMYHINNMPNYPQFVNTKHSYMPGFQRAT